jgi:putative membrane protein
VLFWQWQSSSARHDRVADRKADRDGDAELNAYNARLTAFAARDNGEQS